LGFPWQHLASRRVSRRDEVCFQTPRAVAGIPWMRGIASGARRSGSLRRLLLRVPLLLDRAGIRWVERMFARTIGVQWIVLETIGRLSGRPHDVVLDIVGHDRPSDTYYVQPARGYRTDWVRNVRSTPTINARIGGRRVRARVRDATGREGADVVLRFVRAHPYYARLIVWFVGYVDRLDRSDDQLRLDLATTPVFAVEVLGSR
jgi:deazaflavin-dependent oxidoreductase (nitroreductase family)